MVFALSKYGKTYTVERRSALTRGLECNLRPMALELLLPLNTYNQGNPKIP